MIESKSLTLEKTVIVGIVNSQQDPNQAKEYLDELAFLVHTAGGIVGQRFVQKMANVFLVILNPFSKSSLLWTAQLSHLMSLSKSRMSSPTPAA